MIDLSELAGRESERVEWKENVADLDNVVKTIVAFTNDFSNLGGGYVVCGVREEKDEHGFQTVNQIGLTSDKLKRIEGEITTKCREKVHPPIVPTIEERNIQGDASKRILIFIIPASKNVHSFRTSKDSSKYYIRIGRETREARNGLLRELLIKKDQIEPWDRRINEMAKAEDIDAYFFRDLLQGMHLFAPEKQLEEYLSDKDSIYALLPPFTGRSSLDNTLKLRNFSILLFGKNPQKYIPGSYTIFSVYKGKDRSEPTAERHEIIGTIVQQARKLIELLNTESYTAFDKTSPIPNQNKYPVRALQEAVVNALVHRDYESHQPTRITVFSDRIEINSPGSLPRPVDEEKFLQGKANPFWRNQTLSYFFNKLQLAQGEGQGIPTILRLMKEEGCPEPAFEFGTENVMCILPAHPRHEIIKELSTIEHNILLGNYIEAVEQVTAILAKDIYNYRALELYCQVHNVLHKPEMVLKFVKDNNVDYKKINPGTLILLSETIGLIKHDNEAIKIASSFLEYAIQGHVEEKVIGNVARSLMKMGKVEKAIDFINESFLKYPDLHDNSAVLETLARGKMDLAAKCIDTGRNHKIGKELRVKAWGQCRKYLIEAKEYLLKALDNASTLTSKDYIQQDLISLDKLKERAKETAPGAGDNETGNSEKKTGTE